MLLSQWVRDPTIGVVICACSERILYLEDPIEWITIPDYLFPLRHKIYLLYRKYGVSREMVCESCLSARELRWARLEGYISNIHEDLILSIRD